MTKVLLSLPDALGKWAEEPRIGRNRRGMSEERRNFFHGSRIVAYRITGAGILIQRILDPRRHWQRIRRRT